MLQSILNEAMNNNVISKPAASQPGTDFPVIQYVEDTVIIMPAYEAQIEQLHNLLMHYSVYTGLRINFDKSVIVPIKIA